MARAFVSIGSNIDPERNVSKALCLLAGSLRAVSTFYRTKPVGRPEQGDFYNGVVEVATELSPEDLRQALRGIERELGRVRSDDKYAPRTIDLDIIAWDRQITDADVATRPFLSIPLHELAPELDGLPEIVDRHREDDMMPLSDFTERLRREMEDEL